MRGMKGVYQHCGKEHLHRYAAEFSFRYNNRMANGVGYLARADVALLGVSCSVPDDHIDPRRSAFFMARSVLRDIQNGVRPC